MLSKAYFKLDSCPFSTTVTPDGRYFICGGLDRTIQLWNIAQGTLEASWAIANLHHFPDCNRIQALTVTEDCRCLIVGGALLQAWNLESRTKIRSYNVGSHWPLAMGSNVLSNTLLTGSGETITAWNLSNKQRRFRFKSCHGTLNFAFTTDGQKFIASDYECDKDVDVLGIYATETGQQINASEVKQTFRPYHLDFNDMDTLIGIGGKGGIQVWDLNSLDTVVCINSSSHPRLRQHLEVIRDVKFLPGGAILMTVGNDGSISFWDVSDGSYLNGLNCKDPIYKIYPIQKFTQVALYSYQRASVELYQLGAEFTQG
ncbi:WD40 repeat domain-containing protein [Acaryochloris sp. CCMEE 5410]|uniref:WD40 repeat domain-containing protein n=1 Tax=Acaryochloris sp. CCMEE 5410 TaxID=310037 RepID=UPI0002484984|nr:WD40 repeat domain-containing protein [Acaryochloris sp. CCMEE 5410]KAI9130744.1 WD40 repeat domain-containing protein [Acaryochloris sp. CCMEE 5410]